MSNIFTADNSLEGLRSIPLYRVSTKKQMGVDDDLPDQKNLVQKFIIEHNMKVVREFVEGGISGYKNTAQQREALMKIIEMAKNKEFDVLVIYHSNRFGRRQDLSPIITELYRYGIRVFSTVEGELKANTPTDILLNDVRFYNNTQESYVKGQVITDYHMSMVEHGRFRGGYVPYGYELVDKGSKNYKGRRIYDMVIDEDQAETVEMIFNLCIVRNYGSRRIAEYLNEHMEIHPPRNGEAWTYSTVNYILKNPMYRGQYHMSSKLKSKDVMSEVIEELVIIPLLRWEMAQKVMKGRTTKKLEGKIEKATTNNHGKLLLSGLLYCGSCGSKLTTSTKTKKYKKADGTITIYKKTAYRCSSFQKSGVIDCKGQSTYSSLKIDQVVLRQTQAFMGNIAGRELQKGFLKSLTDQTKELKKKRLKLLNDKDKANRKLKALQDEFVKVLTGESNSDKEMVNSMISKSQMELENIDGDVKELAELISNSEKNKDSYLKLDSEIVDWNKKFEESSDEIKKAMLFKIIDRIEISPDDISIFYGIKLETYLENSVIMDKNSGVSCNSLVERLVRD